MKKYITITFCVILGILLFLLCYNYKDKEYPNEYYNVYLDGEYLGTILSKKELENYIDKTAEHLINIEEITKTYCENEKTLEQIIEEENISSLVKEENYYESNGKKCIDVKIKDGEKIEKMYYPNGLEIEKILSYNGDIISIEEVYSKIVNLKSFTIKGYQFTLNDLENEKITKIYTIDKSIFEEAVDMLIETYVGKEEYSNYLQDNQEEIETVGSVIQNVYIEEDINVKETQIPIDSVIYTNSNDLAQFLLYGNNPVTKTYIVKESEMISDIALKNEISNREFLISNPRYKDENVLIKVGTEVYIRQTNPQLKVVVEKYSVEDKSSDFKTIYEYDSTQYIGYEKVKQEGEKGLERISQRLKIVNGSIVYIEPKGKETLKNSVDKIVIKGDKYVPNVGDLNNWLWPSESGWTSTSGYSWRIHPVTGVRAFHYGIDIGGTGYNSDIYASNNGTIITREEHYSFGLYIVIDHNNGYYTLYAHMNKFAPNLKVGDTVARGQLIGYVGSTGQSTGPHIHFELWKGCKFCRVNPWSIFR